MDARTNAWMRRGWQDIGQRIRLYCYYSDGGEH